MKKFNYIVWYKSNGYNPYRTYPQNADKRAQVKYFANLDEAIAFAKTVKNAQITDFVNTMKKINF